MQVDPIGYEDQFNLYAYVGNDPINAFDPTGKTCVGPIGNQVCKIDLVQDLLPGNDLSLPRAPTDAEQARFADFNQRYTDTTNQLARNPNQEASVRRFAPGRKNGSFETDAGKAAASMAARKVIFIDYPRAPKPLGSPGGPGTGKNPVTYVFGQKGLDEGPADIVHDMGLHGSPEEVAGGLQTPEQPLATTYSDAHQDPYTDASCDLLQRTNCGN